MQSTMSNNDTTDVRVHIFVQTYGFRIFCPRKFYAISPAATLLSGSNRYHHREMVGGGAGYAKGDFGLRRKVTAVLDYLSLRGGGTVGVGEHAVLRLRRLRRWKGRYRRQQSGPR